MKYVLLAFLPFLWLGSLWAQNDQERLIFNAMQDEMKRNKEQLQLPGLPAPYYLSYTLGRYRQFEVVGALGGIINSFKSNWEAQGGVQMLIGNDQHNSDFRYICQINQQAIPCMTDYEVIRKAYWLSSDITYKWVLQADGMKQNYLKSHPQSPEESALADRCPVPAISRIQKAPKSYTIDLPVLEKAVKELSLIFKDYKEIYNSTVAITGLDLEIFKTTTEGVVLKQPVRYAHLSVKAYVTTEEGSHIHDSYTLLVACPGDLPDIEDLKKNIRIFADNLLKLKNAPVIKEYYEGPVLFENAAVSSIFTNNFLKRGVLFAWRKPQTDQMPAMKTLDSRMGMKIIDSRLSIKNYTSLEKYNGVDLMGAYCIDAEGVVPEKEITLVEKGIFKQMLNGSVPTLHAPQSTGSSRFVLSPKNGAFVTAPGTIHIKAEKGSKPEKMKAALIRAAKEEGLEYAYIVKKMAAEASQIYQVNLKNGKETLVRFGDVIGFTSVNLKRMLGISSKENVSNYILNGRTLSSLIYPSSILLGNIEINKSDVKKDKEQVLTFPLQRVR